MFKIDEDAPLCKHVSDLRIIGRGYGDFGFAHARCAR